MSATNRTCHSCGEQGDLQTVRARNGFPAACCANCAPEVAAPVPEKSGRRTRRHLGFSAVDGRRAKAPGRADW